MKPERLNGLAGNVIRNLRQVEEFEALTEHEQVAVFKVAISSINEKIDLQFKALALENAFRKMNDQ